MGDKKLSKLGIKKVPIMYSSGGIMYGSDVIGNLRVGLRSDMFDGEVCDTEVNIEGGVLCTVSGESRLEFIKELQSIVDKYRI